MGRRSQREEPLRWFARRERKIAPLRTPRLALVAITPELLEAEENSLTCLAAMLPASVPSEWPPADWEPHVRAMIALQCADTPRMIGWHRYMLLLPSAFLPHRSQLIGCLGGFPKAAGEVEIGYSTLPAFQRQGYGSEAARVFVDWLLMQDSVTAVTAQAFLHKSESLKVMQRCGMVPAGPGDDPGTTRYRRGR